MDTQARRLRTQQKERETKTFRIGLDLQTLNRIVQLEDATQIEGEVWIEAVTLALLSAYEKEGSLTLPLSVVSGV